jgi:mRNA interferase HicA
VKRVDLIRSIEKLGCILVRHGAKHDWYRNPGTGVSQPVPRHREINEQLARHIIRMLSAQQDDATGSSGGNAETA